MSGKKNLTGKHFGRLLAIEDSGERDASGVVLWKCKCDCGNTTLVRTSCLTGGRTNSCGCLRGEWAYRDLTKQRFGRLVVIEDSGIRQGGNILWLCLCDCGNTKEILTNSLTAGKSLSCGCIQKEAAAKTFHALNKHQIGEDHPRWTGGQIGRTLAKYLDWRIQVFRRDGFRCTICHTNRRICAHHLESWGDNPGRRFDSNNGLTLCRRHHRRFHNMFGYGLNTRLQFRQYRERIAQ